MNQKVYLAIVSRYQNLNILGVYSSERSAVNRCISENSYSRTGWIKNDDEHLKWNNGFGLEVKVLEHLIIE